MAAASDLQAALPEIASAFEKTNPGVKVTLVFGSSGKLYQQILEGAPFDVFFSADEVYPKNLEAKGALEGGTRKRYAIGRLAVWLPSRAGLKVNELGLKALLEPGVKRIAIANPEHAPYGRAALSLFEKAGVLEALKPKLVYGENVSQAAQFALTAADAGVIALSVALTPAMQNAGSYWLAPLESHDRLNQEYGVIAGRNRPEVLAFYRSIGSKPARAVLERYGFLLR